MDLKMRDFFGLSNTRCFVRVERMDEKRMQQYLDEYRLKMRSPLNSHRKINGESKSLKGNSVLEKEKKSYSKKHKKRGRQDVEEFEDEGKQGGKRKLEEDPGNSKPKKKKRSEPEVEKNVKPDSCKENKWSNCSEMNVQNKLIKNRWSLKKSGEKKVLRVSWSLFGSSRDRKDSANEEGRMEKVDGFKRKKSKGTKPKKCEKSTMFSGCLNFLDKVKPENDSCSDKSDAKNSCNNKRNVVKAKKSESCSENDKENIVVQDSAVRRVDVESGVHYSEDDYDSREDNSEDDKGTVIFEGDEPEKEKVKTIQKTNFQDVTGNVMPGQRKKRKRVKGKRKRKNKRSQGGVKIVGGGWKEEKKAKSCKFFPEKVLNEVSSLVKRLNKEQRIIAQSINVMPRSGDMANHFKTVILPRQKNFQKEIWKNHKTIMRCYDDLMNVCKNPLDVTVEISKRTLLNVEDVHNIISQCVLVENTAKQLRESGEMKENGKSREPIKFPTECPEKTGFGGPEHLKSHSNAAGTNNTGTQISRVPPLRYFSTENSTSRPDCVQKAGVNASAAAVRRDPRQNYGQPASHGIVPSLKGSHIETQQHSRQTNVHLYSTETAVNYPPIVQQNDPRGGNPLVQTQSVDGPAVTSYVYNVVPVAYPVPQDKIFGNNAPDPGGVLFNSPAPRYVHPSAGLSSIGPRDPRVALSISGSRDPRVALSISGSRDPRVALSMSRSRDPRVALSMSGSRDPRVVLSSLESRDARVDGEKQPAIVLPAQIMIYTSSQSSESLTSAHFPTNPPGENVQKVTSLPVVQPLSVQTNNFTGQAIPNAAPNLLREAQSQPVSRCTLPPEKNATVRAVPTEKPAFENEARSVSIRSVPKAVPVNLNPVLSRSQHQLKEVTNLSNRGTDSPSSSRASGHEKATAKVFNPTTPQKLIMKAQRLQAGDVLACQGEKAEREDGVTAAKVSDRKSSDVENQRTYVCAGDGCKNPGIRVCKMCLSVIYCSDTCQWKHWTVKHRDECYKLRELRG